MNHFDPKLTIWFFLSKNTDLMTCYCLAFIIDLLVDDGAVLWLWLEIFVAFVDFHLSLNVLDLLKPDLKPVQPPARFTVSINSNKVNHIEWGISFAHFLWIIFIIIAPFTQMSPTSIVYLF